MILTFFCIYSVDVRKDESDLFNVLHNCFSWLILIILFHYCFLISPAVLGVDFTAPAFPEWILTLILQFTANIRLLVHVRCIDLPTLNLSLTLSWRRTLSYRNQFIDLLCKSMDWFLYDNGLRHERVKVDLTIAIFL